MRIDLSELKKIVQDSIESKQWIEAVFSSPKEKNEQLTLKVTIRAIQLKGQWVYQISRFKAQKAFHSNVSGEECFAFIFKELIPFYKQAVLFTRETDFQILTNKKGDISLLRRPSSKAHVELVHNRPKKHILNKSDFPTYLHELGLVSAEGKVLPQKSDKLKQINRFLELVQDVITHLPKNKKLTIVDFGCGKAYLTFALYDFLKQQKGMDVSLHGLDLKQDLIAFCQDAAKRLHYEQLHFSCGKIAQYKPDDSIDMVVSLHACNTATDEALAQAVRWRASVILAAPCCQHELYHQVKSTALDSLLQHGILRERFAALATDAARADILTMHGYSTQVIEFIDSEHTPKNLLIRAVRGASKTAQEKARSRYLEMKQALGISPALECLLDGGTFKFVKDR